MSGGEVAIGVGALVLGLIQSQSGRDAASAVTKASDSQIAAQREALNYMKEIQAVPEAYRREALVQLGQLYGLKGSSEFIDRDLDTSTKYAGIPPGTQPTITRAKQPADAVTSGVSQEEQLVGAKPQGLVASEYYKNPITPTYNVDGYELTEDQMKGYEYIKSMKPGYTVEDYLQMTQAQEEKDIQEAVDKFGKWGFDFTEEDIIDIKEKQAEETRQKTEDALKENVPVPPGTEIVLDPETDEIVIRDIEGYGGYSGPKYPELTQSEMQQKLIDQATASPLYSHLLSGRQAGEEAILRQQSAMGRLRSGSTAHALYDYNTQLQNNALMQAYNQQLMGLNQMAGLSTDPQAIASMMSSIGATQAAGISGAAQAGITGTQNAINSLFGLAGDYLKSI